MGKIKAEVHAYSSVVGGGVLLVADSGKGRMLGQIAFLCHDDALRDRETQARMAEVIANIINVEGFYHD